MRVVIVALVLGLCSAAAGDPSPEVKLKLGHYHSKSRGIGLVIDLTHKEARIRWDGTQPVIKLDPVSGPGGRTDYIKSVNHVVLQVWDDGRAAVFVTGSSTAIAVTRDGDADPL